jgi:hypothetical protein
MGETMEKLIHFEVDLSGRIQEPPNLRKGQTTGRFPSIKLGRTVHFGTPIELAALVRLEADGEVKRYSERSARIVGRAAQSIQPWTHVPNALVEYEDYRELRDFSSDAEAATKEVIERTSILTHHLARMGFGYHLWKESEIVASPEFPNAQFLLDHGARDVDTRTRKRVCRFVAAHGSIPWRIIAGGIFGGAGIPIVCRLLLEGVLEMDMSERITSASSLSLRQEPSALHHAA